MDMTWESQGIKEATITAGRDGAFSLDLPGDCRYEITRVSDGARCNVTASRDSPGDRQRVGWQMVSGETYRVVPKERSQLGR